MHLLRQFCTSCSLLKHASLKNAKNKGASSQHWLLRQLKDPYVEKAKLMNYRCRSAFKLLELDERFKLLHPGQVVIDCGASPGSWSQVAVKKVNADGHNSNELQGLVISVDKQPIFNIEGATVLGNSDFTKEETQEKIKSLLDDRTINVVLSDMAPNATGIKDVDTENIVTLCFHTLQFAVTLSEVGATLVMKLWQCGQQKRLEETANKFYKSVKIAKPDSSRSDSAEIFLVCREFKGLKVR